MKWTALLLPLQLLAIDCFNFEVANVPDKISHPEKKIETWCYQKLKDKNFQTFIFNLDGEGVNPNLAMLIGHNNELLFMDQLMGKTRVFLQKNNQWNPYQIPFQGIDKNKTSFSLKLKDYQTIEGLKRLLLTSKKNKINFSLNKITDDLQDEEYNLPADLLPSDGYWWPFRDIPMARPENSPTKIYDLYVEKKTGSNPNSTNWELQNHSLQNIFWGGHCNGWVASTILHGFFDKSLIFNGEIIKPYQIQGLRTESSFCVKFSMFGQRYRNENDNLTEISPDLFHKTIRYYIREMQKPVAVDRISNEVVDNSIFSGYRMEIEKEESNRYYVTAYLRTHFYSYAIVNSKRVASIKTLRYAYYLTTDGEGNINGGQWDSPNPDFLWIPLAQMNCGRENPRIDPKMIDQMIQTLPLAN